MIFSTSPSCSPCMHHLVADSIEVYGGSRQLIKLLKRLGVCVSTDTHDRFVTLVAEQQKNASVWSELPTNTFTFACVDNIDFLQSHAAMYCGDQTRSYHGTTIQIVQPVPSLCNQLSTNSHSSLLQEQLSRLYKSNAQEADMRVWRHGTSQTQNSNILIYSLDTDVFNIGLPLVHEQPSRQYVVPT